MADVIIRLFDTGDAARVAVLLLGTQPNDGDPITITNLQIHRQGPLLVDLPVVGNPKLPSIAVQADGVGLLKLRETPRALEARFQFTINDMVTDLLGIQLDVTSGVAIELQLNLGPRTASDLPVAILTVEGRVRAAGTPAAPIFISTVVGFQVIWDELPTFPSTKSLGLELVLPGQFPWPRPRLPFDLTLTLPQVSNSIRLPAYSASLANLQLEWGWDAVIISADVLNPADVVLLVEVKRLRIKGLLDLFVSLRFKFTGTDATVETMGFAGEFDLSGLMLKQVAPECFGIDAQTTDLKKLVGLFSDEVESLGTGAASTPFQLRIHAPAGHLEELRLDWTPPAGPLKLPLPGFEFNVSNPPLLSLIAKPNGVDEQEIDGGRLVLVGTFPTDTEAQLATTFGWLLDDQQQEKLADGKGKPDSKLSLTFKLRRPLSVAAIDIPLSVGKARWMRRLTTPLAPLDQLETELGAEGEEGDEIIRGLIDPCPDTSLVTGSFTVDDINPASVVLTLPGQPFTFPFLNGRVTEGDQFLQVTGIDLLDDPQVDPNPLVIQRQVNLLLKLGTLEFTPSLIATFDVERMAFRVDIKRGIPLKFNDGNPVSGNYLGLNFSFTPNANKEAFILVIDGRNYAIQQAPGAVFTVAHDKATMPGESLEFAIRDFVISPKGLSLTASITDKPARLNGLETQFRFTEGELKIIEGKIAGFTIAGSGPLPPDLVGDAVAEVALQFAQENNHVQLVRGSAKIRGPKLLSCKSTRFEFELDSLGLNFVHEGNADHLYFTLSGKARYKLQSGDDASGPLAWLPGIEIQLIDCPLTGNARVIAKHVQFLIELPKKLRFSFLGCFTMELRAIGFVPQFDKLGDVAAMRMSGQIMLGDTGDLIDSKIDLHDLYIALPKPGDYVPRLYLKSLGIRIAQGDTFALEAVVDFYNGEEIEPGIFAFGFVGEGSVTIKGLPPIAASMAWLRVSRDEKQWRRAWFLYLEARQISLRIPVVEIYIREIGFGFGYRYTLAVFKAADETSDVRKLLKKLKEISRTQGNLSKRSAWKIDLEDEGEDARWTVAIRALFASASAQTSPFNGYDADSESILASVYILDAVLAVRSDLTFFLVGRAWLNTNYHDFHTVPGLNEAPLLSGFMMLSPKQSRFLANLSSNPGAKYGDHPPLPDFIKELLSNSKFTATLLIEPGLLHYELGWPNQLQANLTVGPLKVEVRAGQIFRLSTRELVVGQSFLARGNLKLEAEFSAGFFGAGLYALADVAYGVRYIGVLAFEDTANNSAFYGAVGLDIRVLLEIQFWLRIKIAFVKISINLSLSIELQFTAALQIGISFPEVAGALGTATISIRVMGRRLGFNVRVGINDGAVEAARQKTEKYLHIGLEAEDVESIPGTESTTTFAGSVVNSEISINSVAEVDAFSLTGEPVFANVANLEAAVQLFAEPQSGVFHVPEYFLGIAPSANERGVMYAVLVPRSPTMIDEPDGFFAVPPSDVFLPPGTSAWTHPDFAWTHPAIPAGLTVEQLRVAGDNSLMLVPLNGQPFTWQMPWTDRVATEPPTATATDNDLRQLLRYAYLPKDPFAGGEDPEFGAIEPNFDPKPYWLPTGEVVDDARVSNPSTAAFDAAVRGAAEQFAAPYFKFDPDSEYDQKLREACRVTTSVYTEDGKAPKPLPDDKNNPMPDRPPADQSAAELRSSIIQAITRDFFDYAANPGANTFARLAPESAALRYGLMFKVTSTTGGEDPLGPILAWLEGSENVGTIRQRNTVGEELCSEDLRQRVLLFNRHDDWFLKRPPEFARVRKFEHANTIAIDWRLEFPNDGKNLKRLVLDDPEHHLRHYLVRREHIDGNDAPLSFTLKSAEVLHREETITTLANGDVKKDHNVTRLPPRFQLVDHFKDQVAADTAALTANGKLYLYTITPIDIAGNASQRPLSVVARRVPAEPPLVPTDGELTIVYQLQKDLQDVIHVGGDGLLSGTPNLRLPAAIAIRFSDPIEPANRPAVPVAKYRVVFRRETVLPIGFYGADENVRGVNARGLALSNARPLRTDIVLEFNVSQAVDDPRGDRADSGRRIRRLEIDHMLLTSRGVFPGKNKLWQPEGWTVFIQTETDAGSSRQEGVRSTLAPVSVRMQFANHLNDDLAICENRRFTRVEWLPNPTRLDLLPPVDTAGEVGFAKVPMPNLHDETAWLLKRPSAATSIDGLQFEQHPARLRAVKMVWNQGPSGDLDHPLDLHARYQVYEFDAFGQLGDVLDQADPLNRIDFPSWASNAELRAVAEVDLLPAGDLPTLPATCSDPQAWEAWHPGTAKRLRLKAKQQQDGTWPDNRDVMFGPWFSFRDSYLQWPNPTGLVANDGKRLRPFHPFLEDVAAVLGKTLANQAFPEFDVEFGPQPARGGDQVIGKDNVDDPNPLTGQPGVLAKLIKSTAPDNDPYGWGLLQRMGLAVGIRLRSRADGRYLNGANWFAKLHQAIEDQSRKTSYVYTAVNANNGVRLRLHTTTAGNYYRLSGNGRGPAFVLTKDELLVSPFVAPLSGTVVLTIWGKVEVLDPQNDPTPKSKIDDNCVKGRVELASQFESKCFLHVEHLFQPGARTKLKTLEAESAGEVEFDRALALVQLSLRPALRQQLRYQRITIDKLEEMPTAIPIAASARLRVTLQTAETGATYVVDNGRPEPPVALNVNDNTVIDTVASGLGTLHVLIRAIDPAGVQIVHVECLSTNPVKVIDQTLIARTAFSPTDWDAATFTNPDQAPFDADEKGSEHWSRFKRLMLGVEPTIDQNEFDLHVEANKEVRGSILSWLDRFFGTGGNVNVVDATVAAETIAAHWIASGYPRASSPLPLAPDSAGRLTYYRPIESLWGQAYRYYVRPRGRYELIWEELGRSRKLVALENLGDIEVAQKRLRAPAPGGADVVLSRIRPLAAPLVLSSKRLDLPSVPGTNTPPGKVWEVLVVEHPEQVLVDKNRTLVHRLEYRQIAQSMLRKFEPSDVRLSDIGQVFRRAISSRHRHNEPNLVSDEINTLYFFHSTDPPIELDVSGNRSLTAIAALVNLQAATTHVIASVDVVGTVDEQVLVLQPDTDVANLDIALRLVDDRAKPSLLTVPERIDSDVLEWPSWENSGPTRTTLPVVPAEPAHLRLINLTAQDASGLVTIDLPLRNTEFSRGVLALQYDALPFYYRHRLLIVAQAAGVVSPITPIDQQDFEYVSPQIKATMDGVDSSAGFGSRRIAIPLARLWDSLPPASQASWPIENPATIQAPAAPADVVKRRPGAILDPAVIYSVVIEKPGSGNVQVVAEYRFDHEKPSGYESRPLPGPFRGVAVRVLPGGPTRLSQLETLLLPTTGANVQEVTTVPISSWRVFQDLPWLLKSPEVFPRQCELQLFNALEPADVAELRAIAATVDVPLADAIRSLLLDPSILRSVVTCVGLEQLHELHDQVSIDTDARTIAWSGAATAQQLNVLDEWIQTTVFSATLTALKAALLAAASDPVIVPIEESFWQPRPTQANLSASLGSRLLLGKGVIGVRGIMSRAQGIEAASVPGLQPADLNSVRQLYDRSLSTGLGGGTLKLIVRRGSAQVHSEPIETTLET